MCGRGRGYQSLYVTIPHCSSGPHPNPPIPELSSGEEAALDSWCLQYILVHCPYLFPLCGGDCLPLAGQHFVTLTPTPTSTVLCLVPCIRKLKVLVRPVSLSKFFLPSSSSSS